MYSFRREYDEENMMKINDIPEIKSIENLDLLAKQVVEGFIIGLHKSPFHGFSVEFAEHRLYNVGDSTKNIDWKVFARTEKLFSKKFEEETNLRCQIIVDASSSMYFPDINDKNVSINKVRFSALAAASLMRLLQKQRDAFGLTIFDEKVEVHTKAKSSTTHYNLLLSYLERTLQKDTGKKTNLASILHEVADNIHKRSLVILFSDMFDSAADLDEIFVALQHVKHNKHEVIIFNTLDKSLEIDLDLDDKPYLLIDLESGEEVKVQADEIREYYSKQVRDIQQQLKIKCLQYKIDLIDADIQAGFDTILMSYLVKRSKMRV